MKQKFIDLYMDFARRVSKLSYATRLQVGAVIVKDDTVISYGFNGTPAGWDNNCEDKQYIDSAGGWLSIEEIEQQWPFEDSNGRYRLKTKPEVLHAERNALDKLAKRGGVGGENSYMFTTHSPCLECAKSIYGAGIKEVYYSEDYRSTEGVYFLQKCGVSITKIK